MNLDDHVLAIVDGRAICSAEHVANVAHIELKRARWTLRRLARDGAIGRVAAVRANGTPSAGYYRLP